jgi:membrane-associated phospholipid phosphatase
MNVASHPFVSEVRGALTRPYRVTLPMVLLVSLVPLYIFIGVANQGRPHYAPAIALDAAIALAPVWSLIYGALYLFLIVLPVLVIRHEDLIRRTVRAYLAIWLAAYAVFLLYPTIAPRPDGDIVPGTGFGAWGLRLLYDLDPPVNCFPSLHVAHSFVGALAVWRMHARLGAVALACAAVVGLSTLFTKQHYVIDVAAGFALAYAAYALFMRGFPRAAAGEEERRAAPAVAIALLVGIALWVVVAFGAYLTGAGPALPAGTIEL